MALYQAPEEVKTGDRVINSRFNEELSHSDHYFNDHQEPDPVLDEEGRHINIPAALDAAHRVDDQEGNQAIVEAARRAPEPDIVDDPALPNAAPPDVPAEVNADEWDELAQMMRAVGMAGPWRGIAQNASLVLLVFNLTLGLAVFLPYVLGKTISLLLVG
ncbi:hypothetical protein PIIN_02826 [Serendipita indica DSM 11827]|uniref:Uncharacterized protein n=1 Tax=Serendipita indica (strain DSM 11827) TaxID=1109443 RepID=G4TCC3_SERID|nr:hypothetical protein PIIN_02826 [Serendipita indica DSM 11827]